MLSIDASFADAASICSMTLIMRASSSALPACAAKMTSVDDASPTNTVRIERAFIIYPPVFVMPPGLPRRCSRDSSYAAYSFAAATPMRATGLRNIKEFR